MRAVAYTEARADDHPDRRLGAADRLRPAASSAAGASCGPCSAPRCSTCGSRWCRRAWRARGRRCSEAGPHRVVLQRQLSRGSACCSARRSSACGTGAPTSTSCSARSARRTRREARRGTIFAAFLKLLPVFIFIIPGMIALALAQERHGRRARRCMVDAGRQGDPAAAQAAFPLMVQHVLPSGLRGIVVAGLLAALMSSLAGAFNACVDAVHDGPLSEVAAARVAGAAGVGRARRDGRDGADRACVDPGDPGRAGPVRLPAGRAGLPGAADLRRCSSSACSSSGSTRRAAWRR